MDDLRERVEAVERALTDGDGDLSALADGAATADRVAALEATVEDLQADVTELEAATQALRGYVGNVRSINGDVEQRADAAVAAVEDLTDRVEALEDDRISDAQHHQSGPGDAQAPAESVGGSDGTSADTDRSPAADGPTIELTPPSVDGDGHDHGTEGLGTDRHCNGGPGAASPGEEERSDEMPGNKNRDHADPGVGTDQHRRSCPACGRGPDGAAADGGQATSGGQRAGDGQAAAGRQSPDGTPSTDNSHAPEGSQVGAAEPTRTDLDGFDPERPPRQVDLRKPDENASSARGPGQPDSRRSTQRARERSTGAGHAGATGEESPGLLARARELL